MTCRLDACVKLPVCSKERMGEKQLKAWGDTQDGLKLDDVYLYTPMHVARLRRSCGKLPRPRHRVQATRTQTSFKSMKHSTEEGRFAVLAGEPARRDSRRRGRSSADLNGCVDACPNLEDWNSPMLCNLMSHEHVEDLFMWPARMHRSRAGWSPRLGKSFGRTPLN